MSLEKMIARTRLEYDPAVADAMERMSLEIRTARNNALEDAAVAAEIALAKTAASDIRRMKSHGVHL